MADTKKARTGDRRETRAVRYTEDRKTILPLLGERAAMRAVVQSIIPTLLTWFSGNARDLPWRRTRDPYAVWVSEIMLQQTQVKTVIAYWERWMRELPTIQTAAKASPAKLHKLWEGLGYYARVRNLQKAAQQILRQHNGKFPENFDDMLALSGIGRYTAGAIASIAFNQPHPILDGNVIRFLTRLFGITTDPREKQTNARLWDLAHQLIHAAFAQKPSVPDKKRTKLLPLRGESAGARADVERTEQNSCSQLNQSLMELGALICTPRSPQCDICPVNKLCIAREQNLQAALPNLGKRKPATARRFIAFVAERDGKFLVRQRPAGVVNAHLWEFPNVEVGARLSSAAALSSKFGIHKSPTAPVNRPRQLGQPRSVTSRNLDFRITSLKPLCTIKHSITRYRITLETYRAELAKLSIRISGRWLTPHQLHKLAFASAHQKILNHLGTPNS